MMKKGSFFISLTKRLPVKDFIVLEAELQRTYLRHFHFLFFIFYFLFFILFCILCIASFFHLIIIFRPLFIFSYEFFCIKSVVYKTLYPSLYYCILLSRCKDFTKKFPLFYFSSSMLDILTDSILLRWLNFILFYFAGMSWGDATVFVLQKQTESRKWRHGELVEGDSDDVGNVLWEWGMFFYQLRT